MNTAIPNFAELPADAHADVCVVGAGIAGLTTAYCLARAGQSVLVLEDGSIGGGETGRTTAHLSDALDDGYAEIERVHGPEGARLAAQSHRAAIERIESIVRDENIACAFTRLDGYLFRGRNDKSDVLERELQAARRAGVEGVARVPSPVPSIDRGSCLLFPRQGQFHPLEYLNGLARALLSAGGQIFTHTRVRAVEDGAPCRVATTRGHTITCRELVVATNSPITDRLAMHTKQAAYRTFAVALQVEPDSVPLGLYWDTEDPYHYVRLHGDGAAQAVLIVGGEDHKTGQAEDAGERFARLETWTRERFAGCGPVRFRWSGQVQEPVDHLAFIGRDPGAKHVYIITGDSGHGMTHGTIAGMLITDLILGRENPWVSLYAPSRRSTRTAVTYARENLNVAKQYADHLTSGDVKEIAAIAPGSGAVVRLGRRKVAVYRDGAGTLHAHSAVCTHVGCIVHWNDLEKTWDCPCHGSRFDVRGEVVNGPARQALSAVSLDGGLRLAPTRDREQMRSDQRLPP